MLNKDYNINEWKPTKSEQETHGMQESEMQLMKAGQSRLRVPGYRVPVLFKHAPANKANY